MVEAASRVMASMAAVVAASMVVEAVATVAAAVATDGNTRSGDRVIRRTLVDRFTRSPFYTVKTDANGQAQFSTIQGEV
jgi:hypothetical protein